MSLPMPIWSDPTERATGADQFSPKSVDRERGVVSVETSHFTDFVVGAPMDSFIVRDDSEIWTGNVSFDDTTIGGGAVPNIELDGNWSSDSSFAPVSGTVTFVGGDTTAPTDLNLNGSMDNPTDYIGVYSIMEKLERDANRINVLAGRKIHDRVSTESHGRMQLL